MDAALRGNRDVQIKELAEMIGCSTATIYNHFQKRSRARRLAGSGRQVAIPAATPPARAQPMSDFAKVEALTMAAGRPMSVPELAEVLEWPIERVAKAMGLPPEVPLNGSESPPKGLRTWTEVSLPGRPGDSLPVALGSDGKLWECRRLQ